LSEKPKLFYFDEIDWKNSFPFLNPLPERKISLTFQAK